MPKAKDARADRAFELYKQGLTLKEIAEQLAVAEGTVRSWKNRYCWEGDGNATLRKNECNVANVANENTKEETTENIAEKETAEDAGLSDKQRLFCMFYVQSRNQVKAYQKAFQCSYKVACSHANAMWKKVEIQNEINRQLNEYRSAVRIETEDLFQWYLDIARADVNDFVDISQGYVQLRGEIDGTIVQEIGNTRYGTKIKLNDRMKAMEWLGEHIDQATEKQKVELELLKARKEMLEIQTAILKAKSETEEETEDDGFLDALNGSAAEDWSDEESNL